MESTKPMVLSLPSVTLVAKVAVESLALSVVLLKYLLKSLESSKLAFTFWFPESIVEETLLKVLATSLAAVVALLPVETSTLLATSVAICCSIRSPETVGTGIAANFFSQYCRKSSAIFWSDKPLNCCIDCPVYFSTSMAETLLRIFLRKLILPNCKSASPLEALIISFKPPAPCWCAR